MGETETVTVAEVSSGTGSVGEPGTDEGLHVIRKQVTPVTGDEDMSWRCETTLEELYVQQRLAQSEIGDRLGCSRRTVGKWLDKYDIDRPTRPWTDETRLRRLRDDERLSQEEIAQRLGCTQGTIHYWMTEYGIPTERIKKQRPWHDERRLRSLYVDRGLTIDEVADELDCGWCTVSNWLDEHGIETRSRNPELPEALTDEETLQRLYSEHGLSTYDIADRLDCAPSAVHGQLCDHGIVTRSVGSHPGELHHRWEGGNDPYYGANWHDRRRAALERDDYRCQRCDISNKTSKQRYSMALDVHHIVPLREFDDPESANDLDNLVALCRACHNAVESSSLGGVDD